MMPFTPVVGHHICDRSFTVEVFTTEFLERFPERQDTGLVSYTRPPSYVPKTTMTALLLAPWPHSLRARHPIEYILFTGSNPKLMAFWDACIYKGKQWSLW